MDALPKSMSKTYAQKNQNLTQKVLKIHVCSPLFAAYLALRSTPGALNSAFGLQSQPPTAAEFPSRPELPSRRRNSQADAGTFKPTVALGSEKRLERIVSNPAVKARTVAK